MADDTSNDRSDDNDSNHQHQDSPFPLTVPWNGIRRRISLFVGGGSSFVRAVFVDGSLSSRVHGRITAIACQ